MRIRQRSTLKSNPAICTYSYELNSCPGGRMPTPVNRLGPLLGMEEIMIDTVTPSWFRKLRKVTNGEKSKDSYVVNPMQRTRYTAFSSGTGVETSLITPIACSAGQASKTDRSVLAGDAFSLEMRACFGTADGTRIASSPSLFSKGDIDSIMDKACTDVAASVRAGIQGCLEDLAELSATYSMLRHPLQSTATLFGTLTKLKWRDFTPSTQAWKYYYKWSWHGAQALFKYGSSQWLTYRYGLRPLVSSITALVTTLNTGKRSTLFTSRSKATSKRDRTTLHVFNDGKFTFTIQRRTVEIVTVRAFSVDSYKASFSTDLGLMPDQIPVTLWNLVTCSFVVDWFLNIGSFINAMVPRVGVTNWAAGYTTVVERTDTYAVVSCSIAPGFLATHKLVQPLMGAATVTWMESRRVPGLRSPKLVINPDFGFSKDVRVADALALLYAKLGHLISKAR